MRVHLSVRLKQWSAWSIWTYKWLMVEPAVEITIRARIIDETRVRVAIEGYAECVLA